MASGPALAISRCTPDAPGEITRAPPAQQIPVVCRILGMTTLLLALAFATGTALGAGLGTSRDALYSADRGALTIGSPDTRKRALATLAELTKEADAIDLIVAPVPRKEVVHADRFSDLAPADGIYLANRQRFLKQLLDADVEVIDFVPGYQKARDQHQWFFYDAEDFHPADGGIQVQAQEIATRLERYEFRKWPSYVPMVSRTRPSEFVVPLQRRRAAVS